LRVLVTGGLGFIGSNLVRRLLKGQEEVVNLDSMSYASNLSNLKDISANKRYKFVKGDITNPIGVEKIAGSVDAIINVAAETHVDRSISSGSAFVKSNVVGVFTLLEGLRRVGRRIPFVQVGSDEEYGEILDGSFAEGDPLVPSSPYAATKASASMLVLAYVRTYGLDAKITRCTNNYGPYQSPEKLVPKTIIRAHMGLKVPVYGNGRNARDWIHVEDHCEALELVMRRGKAGSVYNVAGGNELQNIDLVRHILRIMGKSDSIIEFVEDRPGHDRRYSLDDRKIRKELGWRPKHRFEDSLTDTIQWYLKNERWWRPLAGENVLSPTPWKLKW
jgi:dTDP-glucose 4,6-dehydratase